MSDIIEAVQLQDPGSEHIVLYDLEYASGSFAYFFNGIDSDLTEVQFRDSTGTARTYAALPIYSDGFDISADGAASRPELSIANIELAFSDSVGGLDYEELIGRRVTRRTTLRKYLVGETGDSGVGNAPVEFPKVVYIIDRIKSKNIMQITFELAAPFDLAGIVLPRRTIIGGSCPFKYKGAAKSLDIADRRGGCPWNANITDQTLLAGWSSSASYPLYLNEHNEYIVNFSDVTTFYTFSSSATAGYFYKTTESHQQVNDDGTLAAAANIDVYWQAMEDTTDSPADNNASWRRIRVYNTYSSSTTYKAYKNNKYNEYVIYNNKLWKVKLATQTGSAHITTPVEGAYWTVGDRCGKTLKSCSSRFHCIPNSLGLPSVSTHKNTPLPFGGFPGAQSRR